MIVGAATASRELSPSPLGGTVLVPPKRPEPIWLTGSVLVLLGWLLPNLEDPTGLEDGDAQNPLGASSHQVLVTPAALGRSWRR